MRFVSKLSAEQWADARRLRAEGVNFTAIGKAFNVTRDAISKHAKREGWDAPAASGSPVGKARPAAPLPNDILQARRSLNPVGHNPTSTITDGDNMRDSHFK